METDRQRLRETHTKRQKEMERPREKDRERERDEKRRRARLRKILRETCGLWGLEQGPFPAGNWGIPTREIFQAIDD